MGEARITFGSLFAGAGGMDLGLERAGLECRWQVEIDPFARRVLAKHWPNVRRHDDVRTFPPGDDPEPWRVDLIAGGFPCQDISYAGNGAGIDGSRSGLFFEIIRVVRQLRPRYLLLENVSALLVRGMDRVLGEVAALGFDAEWECLPAAIFGAPHFRDRIFLLAHPGGDGREFLSVKGQPKPMGLRLAKASCERKSQAVKPSDCRDGFSQRPNSRESGTDDPLDHRTSSRRNSLGSSWLSEPDVVRVVDGLPSELDGHRLRAIGNAVVPQVAEWIGRRLMESLAPSPA